MDPSFSISYEQRQILDRIQEAQELGVDCYIRSDNGAMTVQVRPGDSPVISLDSLGAVGEVDFSAIDFSYGYLEAPIQAGSDLLGGGNGGGVDRFDFFFDAHPLESIETFQDLVSQLTAAFGSGSDWRVYCGFLHSLPEQVSDEVLERLVVPLLAAGELQFVPEDAAELLKKQGWSTERIQSCFSMAEREQRGAQSMFLNSTGVPVAAIRSASDLFEAISPSLTQEGNFYATQLVCTFIRAHHFTRESEMIEQIVFPFLSHFGPQGYSDMVTALAGCEHLGTGNEPRYSGVNLPGYGDAFL